MAYTKVIADADAYFKVGNHIAGPFWESVDDQEKNAAFSMAKRELERMKGSALVDPSSGNVTRNDVVREDYAHYEYTLYLIASNPLRANGEQTGTAWDLTGVDGENRDGLGAYKPKREAFKWMGWNQRFIVRG